MNTGTTTLTSTTIPPSRDMSAAARVARHCRDSPERRSDERRNRNDHYRDLRPQGSLPDNALAFARAKNSPHCHPPTVRGAASTGVNHHWRPPHRPRRAATHPVHSSVRGSARDNTVSKTTHGNRDAAEERLPTSQADIRQGHDALAIPPGQQNGHPLPAISITMR